MRSKAIAKIKPVSMLPDSRILKKHKKGKPKRLRPWFFLTVNFVYSWFNIISPSYTLKESLIDYVVFTNLEMIFPQKNNFKMLKIRHKVVNKSIFYQKIDKPSIFNIKVNNQWSSRKELDCLSGPAIK